MHPRKLAPPKSTPSILALQLIAAPAIKNKEATTSR